MAQDAASTWEPVTVGCMFPGATNFDPAANAIGVHCHWRTLGCTNPEALNYNPEATIDIPAGKDGACILPTVGCTIGSASSDAFIGVGSGPLKAAGGWSNSPTNRDMYIGIPGIVQKEAEGNAPSTQTTSRGDRAHERRRRSGEHESQGRRGRGVTQPYELVSTWDTPMLNYNRTRTRLAGARRARARSRSRGA